MLKFDKYIPPLPAWVTVPNVIILLLAKRYEYTYGILRKIGPLASRLSRSLELTLTNRVLVTSY